MLETLTVSDLVSQPPLRLPASVSAGEAARALLAAGQGVAALCGEDGRLAGLITADAFVRLVADGEGGATSARALATMPADSLHGEDSALDALTLMARRGVLHLPVVDADGRLVGIVSAPQLLAMAEAALAEVYRRREGQLFGCVDGAR